MKKPTIKLVHSSVRQPKRHVSEFAKKMAYKAFVSTCEEHKEELDEIYRITGEKPEFEF